MTFRTLLACFAGVALGGSIGPMAQAQSYAITNLGTLGGSASEACSISASGQVVGWSFNARERRRAFLYQQGRMRDLGTLGGTVSEALGINDRGEVVGWAAGARGERQAFIYRDGVMRALGTPHAAHAINDAGHAVGFWWSAARKGRRALFCGNGNTRDLGTLGGNDGEACGINGAGRVVGWASTRYNWFSHAFLSVNGRMHDLGTLGGDASQADGINAAGQVIGWADTADKLQHAFLYSGGQMRDLGTLGGDESAARGLNRFGQVVGWSDLADGRRHAFLCSNGVMCDLNGLIPADSRWVLTAACAINDRGQIAGYGRFQGKTRAFSLTPWKPQLVARVPSGPRAAPPAASASTPGRLRPARRVLSPRPGRQ